MTETPMSRASTVDNVLSRISQLESDANYLRRNAAMMSRDPNTGETSYLFGTNVRVAGDITPTKTDTYNLGSTRYMWNQVWASEIEAVVFAINTITVTGGRQMIAPMAGVIEARIFGGDTSVNLGADNTYLGVNDFIVMRNAGQVEHMQLTSYVGNNVWNVTRNLEGDATVDEWPEGTPWASLGYSTDGWIMLDAQANSTNGPILVFNRQGTAYNSQTPYLVIGDLNGYYGFATSTWAVGIGISTYNHVIIGSSGITFKNSTTTMGYLTGANWQIGPSATEHISLTASNITFYDGANAEATLSGDVWTIGRPGSANVRISQAVGVALYNSGGEVTIQLDNSGNAYISRMLHINSNGAIRIGSGSKDVDLAGWYLDNTEIVGQNGAGTDRVTLTSTGTITAGSGSVTLDEDGVTILSSLTQAHNLVNQLKWEDGSNNVIGYLSVSYYTDLSVDYAVAETRFDVASLDATRHVDHNIYVFAGTTYHAQHRVEVKSGTTSIIFALEADSDADTFAYISGGGLAIHSASAPTYNLQVWNSGAASYVALHSDATYGYLYFSSSTLRVISNVSGLGYTQFRGDGTNRHIVRIYSGDNTEYLNLQTSGGNSYISLEGPAPGNLHFNHTANGGIYIFQSAASGVSPEVRIYGNNGGTLDTLIFTVNQAATAIARITGTCTLYRFITSEGTNTDTRVEIIGKGTGLGYLSVNTYSSLGQAHVDQSDSAGAIPVIVLDQADDSEGFINFVGNSAASAVGPISTWTSGNSIQGFVRAEINGAQYWIPYYNAPTS